MTFRDSFAGVTVLAALGVVAVVVVSLVRPGSWDRALDVYLLFLAGLFLFALARVTRKLSAGEPSELESRLARRRRARRREEQRLPELARLEREVVMASAGAFDLHRRVRPILREIAEHRLLSRRGILLDEDTDEARELLGETTWDLVRADRPPPEDRHGRGLEPAELERVVQTLERL